MIAGIEIENGSCDPDHAPFRGGLSSMARWKADCGLHISDNK